MSSNKILFLSIEFPPQPGGIGNHAHNLAQALHDKGKQIHVLTNNRTKDGNIETEFDTSLPFLVTRVSRKKVPFFTYINRIRKAMSLAKSHNVIMASGKYSLWMLYMLQLRFNKKFIAIVHGSELLLPNSFLRKFTNHSLQKSNQIIAVSNFTKGQISNSIKTPITVIPNGFSINVSNYRKETITKPLHLITVGNVSKRKGQHNVISALPKLVKQYPNLKYHIVGIPSEKESIEEQAKSLNVENFIQLYGKVSESEKIDLLKKATIFLMLSETTNVGAIEGFGIAILEANAFGVPAIGSINCGIEDAIAHHKSGILVNPKDTEAIFEAVSQIVTSYEEYSNYAVEWSNNFGWESIVNQYLTIIDR